MKRSIEKVNLANAKLEAIKDFKNFEEIETQTSVIERQLLILSEASKRIPQNLRDKGKEINWDRLRDLGNDLRHDYDQIYYKKLHDTIKSDLPKIKDFVGKTLLEEVKREHSFTGEKAQQYIERMEKIRSDNFQKNVEKGWDMER